MGTFRSQVLRRAIHKLAFVQSQLRPQLLPLLVDDTTDPEEIFARVLGTLAYLKSLNTHQTADFDRWRLDKEFKPSIDLLKRAQQGYEMARSARLAMANLVDLFPTNNKYILAWTEANKMDAEMASRMEEAKTIQKAGR